MIDNVPLGKRPAFPCLDSEGEGFGGMSTRTYASVEMMKALVTNGQIPNNKTDVAKIAIDYDPICPRASLGGKETDGFYLVYRGDREKVLAILRQCTRAFEAYQTVPEEKPSPHIVKRNFGSS